MFIEARAYLLLTIDRLRSEACTYMRKGLLLRELHVLPSNFLESTLFLIEVAITKGVIIESSFIVSKRSLSNATAKYLLHQPLFDIVLMLTLAAVRGNARWLCL